ncbi:hypothetical protein INS49_007183 [Diaporthe citri]|uniref:uncharacterized protein n=1 Tax=Diaporthe citri TaxID=83186 RepID=UPI001C7F3E2A|nr:uncharacterized protein INS49_007183 [Diaporthe citri]KAG6365572.1 hypothetical protein INS49_007183 [Diaporthe citri]
MYHEINLTLTITLTRHAYTLCATTQTKQQRTPSQTPHPQTSSTQHALSALGRQPLPLVQPTAHDMGELVEPATQAPSPPPAPAPALSLLLSKKALDASRTEILVFASGILFLASQVCLLVWILRRTGAAPTAPHRKEHRKVAIVLPPATEPSPPAAAETHEDGNGDSNGNDESLIRLRRRSTWGGRSSHPGSLPRGRRKSAGSRSKAHDCGGDDDDDGNEEDEGGKKGGQTSLSSPGLEQELDSEAGYAALTAIGDIGRMAAALATPNSLPLNSGGGSHEGAEEDMELREFDPRRAWGEAGLLGASIEKPRSPRSPRVLAADQAAMMDALCAEEGEERERKAAAPSPVGGIEGNLPALSSGFDDPLGVNRLVALPSKDDQGPEGIELESREEGRDS